MDIDNLTTYDIEELDNMNKWDDIFSDYCPICSEYTVQTSSRIETEHDTIHIHQCTKCRMIIGTHVERMERRRY